MNNNNIIINSILDILRKYLNTYDIYDTGKCIIEVIMNITNSKMAFISQIKENNDIVMWAITDNACTMNFKNIHEKDKCLMHENKTIIGKILESGDYVIINNKEDIILPEGHNPLNNFLGIPLKVGNNIIGIMALGNSPNGYNTELIDNISPIISTITTIIFGMYKEENERLLRENVLMKENELRIQKEISETQNNFLAIMSHEIRTPLNGICGITEILKDTKLGDEQKEYVEIIETCSEQLKYLIDNILDYSKLKSKKLDLINEKFKFIKCIEDSFDTILTQANNIELYYNIDNNVPNILIGDEYRLGQIIKNLLSNSIKFTNKGYVSLKVNTINEKILNSIDKTNKNKLVELNLPEGEFTINNKKIILLFQIMDTGIGIESNKLDNIFNNFVQSNNTYCRYTGGVGLGLAIVKSLVELMNGNIWIHSELNKGTIIYFTIKIEVADKYKKIDKHNKLKTIDYKSKVLIVDDNSINRKILFKYLLSWKIYPTMTSSSEDTILLLESGYDFDLILLDIHMPNINGIKLAQIIKEKWSNIKLIALTSITDLNWESRKLFEYVLTKPIKKNRLKHSISIVLNNEQINKKLHKNIINNNCDISILLVEDNEENRIVGTKILNKLGYNNITTANDGKEALELIRNNVNDFWGIILLDIIMPIVDGYIVAKTLKNEYGEKILSKIIMLSALVTEQDIIKFRNLGIKNYITKPFDSKKLKKIIENIINKDE